MLALEAQLGENVRKARLDGDTPQLQSERARIIRQLNLEAIAGLGLAFNDLCGEIADFTIDVQITLDDLPPATRVFIGRADETEEFRHALSVLVQPDDSAYSHQTTRKVFLIRGEGGMGKSTLLRRYADMCETRKDELFWIYIDWDKTDIDAQRGTVKMIDLLTDRIQTKYQRQFVNYQTAQLRRARVQKEVDRLRLEFKGNSREEFDRFLKVRLPASDYEFYENPQRHLSQTFVRDLLRCAEDRPVVLLFDSYERVWDFADQWIRRGLLRFCLTHPQVGNRFMFIIAGRVPEIPLELEYRDNVREFVHERALYYKALDRFTPKDIIEYFHSDPELRTSVSDEIARKIHEKTLGIPLAVSALATILKESGDPEDLLADIERPTTEQEVIGLIATRFLKHLHNQPPETRDKERDCIYSFALMRESEEEESNRRTQLLREIWLKAGLIKSGEEFWSEVQSLRCRYSFLFDVGSMHPDVRSFIRKALCSTPPRVDPGGMSRICEVAVRISELRLKECFREIQTEYGEERAKVEKYRHIQWQRWLLDLVNYRLWLQEYETVMELLIEHYILGMQYGSENLHQRLLSLTHGDPVFYDALPGHHRDLVNRMANLKEWLGRSESEAERDKLFGLLKGEAQIEGRLLGVRAAIDRGNFDTARVEIMRAEHSYRKMDQKNERIETKLADTYHLLGRRLAQSSKRKHVQQESLALLQRACDWAPDNPHIHCALGNVLVNLWRLEEARLEYQGVRSKALVRALFEENYRKALKEAEAGLERIGQLEGSGHYLPSRQARLLTIEANSLSALGEFDRAEQLFRAALRAWPTYVPACVKFSHLLRQEARIKEALGLLGEINLNSITDAQQQAMLHDAYGALYSSLEDWDKAREAYQEAMNLSPEYINPYNNLGKVYIRQNQAQLALDALERGWKIKMRSRVPIKASLFWVQNNMGMAYLMAGQPAGAIASFQFAESLCQRQFANESRQYQTWSNLGLALLGQQRYHEAIGAFEHLAQFSQIRKAQGFLRELVKDVELIGAHDKKTGWQQIRAFVASLM